MLVAYRSSTMTRHVIHFPASRKERPMKGLRVSASQLLALSVFVFALAGCGGGASTSPLPAPVTPIPTATTATLQGQWQIVAHSNVNPASSLLVEANFTQTGSTVTADSSSVVLVDGAPGAVP